MRAYWLGLLEDGTIDRGDMVMDLPTRMSLLRRWKRKYRTRSMTSMA